MRENISEGWLVRRIFGVDTRDAQPSKTGQMAGAHTDTAKSDTNGPPEPGPRCLSGKGDALVTDGPGLSSFLEVTKEPGTFV